MSLREMRDSYQQNSAQTPPVFEHPCAALKKILSSGSFYYALSPHWDISSRLAERLSRDSGAAELGAFDDRFVWNEYIVRSLLDFRERLDMQEREDLDRCQFVVSASPPPRYIWPVFTTIGQVLTIQGYVGVFTIPLPAPPTNGAPTIATLTLISRLGSKRAGTRFNTRGVDDDGNTANFVEVSYV
jgi:synaptojanin